MPPRLQPHERTQAGEPYWITQAEADAILAHLDDGELARWITRHRVKWLPTIESRCTIPLSRGEHRRVAAMLGHPLPPQYAVVESDAGANDVDVPAAAGDASAAPVGGDRPPPVGPPRPR